MADLVFAFDPALDRPVPVPDAAPPPVADVVASAAAESFAAAVEAAITSRAAALVLCGHVLDPLRASPAQAAVLRRQITSLAAEGCATVVAVADATTCPELVRMLGEPAGLRFVTPAAPLIIDVGGITVEIASGFGPAPAGDHADAPGVLRRRIVLGWDEACWHADADLSAVERFAAAAAASPAWSHPGTLWVWGSRAARPFPAGVHRLPPVQARSAAETAAGSCCGLALLDRDAAPSARGAAVPAPRADWRGSWAEIATHRVAWRTLAIESPAGGDEELATAIWAALEGVAPESRAAIELVTCLVECGTSVARRVRVAEIAAETLARVRQLFDAASFRVWCQDLLAHPHESLAPLGHTRSGSRPGTTTSFSSALADIVAAIEQSPDVGRSAAVIREAGWLALELVESG